MNRTFKETLTKLKLETGENWVSLLPFALLRARCTPYVKGLTPFEIMFGRPPSSPALQSSTAAARQIVRAAHQEAHPPDPDSPPVCAPGDLVWVQRHDPGTQARVKGPFQVILSTPTAIKVGGKKCWIHRTRVKKADETAERWTARRTDNPLKNTQELETPTKLHLYVGSYPHPRWKNHRRVTTSGVPTIGADLCKIFGEGWNRPPTVRDTGLSRGNTRYVATKTYGCAMLDLERELWRTQHYICPREGPPGCGSEEDYFCSSWGSETLALWKTVDPTLRLTRVVRPGAPTANCTIGDSNPIIIQSLNWRADYWEGGKTWGIRLCLQPGPQEHFFPSRDGPYPGPETMWVPYVPFSNPNLQGPLR
ncbi:hypothetical protein QTO34_004162 [Cnephaeus nilssonii]|uniref:Murine leukemia virus integrase C-terminal domain-containing protein n=1 Tax=Cnephaeus nilssonii TaxID=3371016 RepID=A0AA40HS05_CNENI|nr:hypothetical protein QTO34_004162 [Eptesicus nilssonii]